MDNIKLTFTTEALDYIVDKAVEYKLGSRGLRSIVETIMTDIMFKAPSQNISKVEITKQYAEEQLESSGSMIA
jgi:ATP-dependent Clp protease ATP-binding subunit ClpX